MKIVEATEVLSGYRTLGRMIRETDKAALFEYYGWEIWIPKNSLLKCGENYLSAAWAIESSKEYQQRLPAAVLR